MQTQNYALTEPRSSFAAGSTPGSRRWPLSLRILFRFTVVFFGLFIFPFPLESQFIGFAASFFTWWDRIWETAVPWMGAHWLHITHSIPYPLVLADRGGDKTFDWIQQLCFVAIAVVAAAIWSVLDRKRDAYPSLHKWARVWIRLFLASQMFGYGAYKLIPVQMPGVALTRMLEPYGNFSPMGVLWNFIGASKGYEITTGCVEVLAGLLLIMPRTALLGALLSIVATTQIFLLNMFYDVPVKIFSFALLLMGVFIVAPDAMRLVRVFFLNRAVVPSAEPRLFRRIGPNRAALAVQILLGLLLLGFALSQARQGYYAYGAGAPKPPLYGIWSVKNFAVDGTVRPPLLTDDSRWLNVLFERYPGYVLIESMDQKFQGFRSQLNLGTKSLVLEKFMRGMGKPKSPQQKEQFSIQQPSSGTLILDGTYEGHHIHADLQRTDETKFLLNSRGFHWINEQSFNK